MNLLTFRNVLLPLLLFSALATNIVVLFPSFWLTARWFLAGALAAYAMATHRGMSSASTFLVTVGAYLLWCMVTIVWSELPSLSAAKVSALIMMTTAGLWGGHLWVSTHERRHALAFLWPGAFVTVVAGLSTGGSAFFAGDVALLTGATSNPNVLGTMVPLCVPVVLWRYHEERDRPSARLFWGATLVLMMWLVYSTVSRGGYLILLTTLIGYTASLGWRRLVWSVAGLAAVVVGGMTLAPETANAWVLRNVYKTVDTDLGVFSRREIHWQESYAAAIAGGLTGAGVGVSVGGDVSAIRSLVSTMGYDREKASSHLAIVEETGLIGLGFYTVLVVALFGTLANGFFRVTGGTRIQLGILIGTLAGLIGQSGLEGWWVGPGSPESIFFWALAGAGLGLGGVTDET